MTYTCVFSLAKPYGNRNPEPGIPPPGLAEKVPRGKAPPSIHGEVRLGSTNVLGFTLGFRP